MRRNLLASTGITLLIVAAAAAGAYWFYQSKIQPPLAALIAKPPVLPPEAEVQITSLTNQIANLTSQIANLTSQLSNQSEALSKQATETAAIRTEAQNLAAYQAKLGDTQAELKVESERNRATPASSLAEVRAVQSRLQILDTQLNDLALRLGQPTAAKTVASTPAETPLGTTEAAPSTNDELVLLKERNRLTLQADEAMATGSAAPLRALWDALRDPDLAALRHGAAAEIIRVQNHLDHLTRLPPDYRLPIQDYFPDSQTRDDEKLPADQLTKVLEDTTKPLTARCRAALLLHRHKTATVGDALVKAMTTDPDLDVVKEAQLSMHSAFGFKVPLFDTRAVEAWWLRNRQVVTADSPPPPTTEPPAPKP